MIFNPMEARKQQLENAPKALAYKGGNIEVWRKDAKNRLIDLLAMPSEKPEQDEFTIEWTREYETYREIRFYFKSEPLVWAPAHILLPKAVKSPPPLIICLQGHGTGMHLSLGRNLQGEDDETVKNGSHAYALQCVSQGMAALTLELRGFGENGGSPEKPSPNSNNCRHLVGSALLVGGRTLQGERVWDVMRTIDIALAHLDGFDKNRIGIMGVSGGGACAFYAAIVDPRIAAALLGCCFSSYIDSIGLISHCPCNYIPMVLNYFDMGDLAGLIAPRPLVFINGNQDQIFPLKAAENQFTTVKDIYSVMGATGKCTFIAAEGGHGFYPDVAWKAFSQLTGWC